jgi:hypothetical protein
MKLIFIAGPFRGPSSWAIEQNVRRAEELARQVWHLGAAALCPHANTRFFQRAEPDDLWLHGSLEMLRRCDAVLMVPGWTYSAGARTEKTEAERHSIPVFTELTALAEWLHQC